MATLSITIPNEIAVRVNDAIAGMYGYQDTIDGEPNPQTKAQFSKQQVINFLKETVKAYEANLASEAARLAASNTAETEIQLT